MKFSDDAKCEYCGGRRNDWALRIDITGLGMGGIKSRSYPISIPTFYVVCINPNCLTKDLDKIRGDLLSKFPQNYTNAIGPTPPVLRVVHLTTHRISRSKE